MSTAGVAFDALLAWANLHGHQRVVALGERYLHDTLLNTALVLPGPTGERNTLSFAPRGNVLCVAANVDGLLNQLAANLACGNRVLIPETASALLPAGLPQIVRDALATVDRHALAQAELRMALVDASLAATWLPQLAARDGALVPLIETTDTDPVPLWRLVAERAICVNTTAAGGNASLMTLEA